MLDSSHTHPHPQPDSDDSFIMIDQDGNTARPITPIQITETPKRKSPVPKPLFTSPIDTTDVFQGSYPEDLIDEKDLMNESHERPLNKPLEEKINDTIFAWSWTHAADTHAIAAELNDAKPVMSPETPSADLDRGTPMDIDPKADDNYSPMTRAFGMLSTWMSTNNNSLDASKTEKTQLDTISEEDSEPRDNPTEPSSHQTSPHLLPEFSQEAILIGQPPSLLDDVSEISSTLTESASTMTLTQDSFSTMKDDKEKMTELPPNPRPWGWNEPTTFLCLPLRLRQAIMVDTVSIKDFHVQRLRVTVVDENYNTPVKSTYKWGSNWRWSGENESDDGGILQDYYQAFVFDDKVKAWGKVLEEVDENLEGDMKGVRRGWKKLGLIARKEKIKQMGWRTMKGSGWNGRF